MQLVVAGKSHPADDGGKALIQEIVRFADDPAVRHRIVFLPDYDMSMARYLYWGCDVWLNNPLRPLEACGTSGMKSALNGGLNLSIRDGWWDELYDGRNGWAIPTADGIDDPHRRDDLEANALYELLGHPGGARVLRPRRRRAGAVGGAGAPHADHAAARRCRPRGWCGSTSTGCTPRPRAAAADRGRRLRARPASSPRTGPGSARRGPRVRGDRRRRLRAAGHAGGGRADDGARGGASSPGSTRRTSRCRPSSAGSDETDELRRRR